MKLTKTDFIQYLNCPKSLWLLKHRPDVYPDGEFTDFQKKLTAEGYEVERYTKELLTSRSDADCFAFQEVFALDNGVFARTDVVRENADGSINIYEIKSSTSVKDTNPHNQIKDAAFQVIAAEDSGQVVDQVFIVHLDGEYVRAGEVDPVGLLNLENVTERVRAISSLTRAEIAQALDLISRTAIDERFCSCLYLSKGKHCDSFKYFNPNIPEPSIYDLPRIHKSKIAQFVDEGRLSLEGINPEEVSPIQAQVLAAAQIGEPVVDVDALSEFYEQVRYPIYFLDYETYSSAIPAIDGLKPQSQLPFQFSLHIKRHPDDIELDHVEYLAERPELPGTLIEALQRVIGPQGSVVSWHKSFENTRNREMGEMFPDKKAFLKDLSERTVDLEDLFKVAYVDIRFGGSTSIKKVLPILAPDLSYEGMEVAGGTEAMDAWIKYVDENDPQSKDELRQALLEYCKLDTYAMVRIFEVVQRLI